MLSDASLSPLPRLRVEALRRVNVRMTGRGSKGHTCMAQAEPLLSMSGRCLNFYRNCFWECLLHLINVGQKDLKRPGVPPPNKRSWSPTHPIKGNFTTRGGERCIFYMSGQRFYHKANPERSYANPEGVKKDGCRKSKV